MAMQCQGKPIESYDEYLAIYFPNRTASVLSHDASPGEMGVQLAIESLEKHVEILREQSRDEGADGEGK